MTQGLDLFLAAPPGLEPALAEEARALGFDRPHAVPGGVAVAGSRIEAMRANLWLRGAGRVLLRVAQFRALHLAQLDKRAHRVDWAAHLRPDVPVRVEAACTRSRIYHQGAAAERVGRAIAARTGAPVATAGAGRKAGPDDDLDVAQPLGPAPLRVLVRIDDDLCTLSIDTSGAPLHRRGYKQAVGKAPLRETLAALFLRQCGFDGREPVLDPMCGSGTFVIEAAEIAAGLAPGRARAFDFERMAGFDAAAWDALRRAAAGAAPAPDVTFLGADRDQGAVAMAETNAARAGVDGRCRFLCQPVSVLERPAGPPGLVMVNPPYGARIGKRHMLHAIHGALGKTLATRFRGWRVGLVTSDAGLAASTGLAFGPPGPPVPHGGLRIRLYRTGPLP